LRGNRRRATIGPMSRHGRVRRDLPSTRGGRFKAVGYLPAIPPAGAPRYRLGRAGIPVLPRKVDLRPLLTPVEDQGTLATCAANAVAGAYEYLLRRHRGEDAHDVSRLFVYYNARRRAGTERRDSGITIGQAIESVEEEGICSEQAWPYDEACVHRRPPPAAYAEATDFLTEESQVVPTDLEAWRGALAEGLPIIFGLKLFESFDRHARRGLIPLPDPEETAREEHGAHAMLCVGYSDWDRVFIVRNSWGADWGDDGYCYLPYDYALDPKHNDGDSWIIRRVENLGPDQSTWGDGSVFSAEHATVLPQLPDRAWDELRAAFGQMGLGERLAYLLMEAAVQDGRVSQSELAAISECLAALLPPFGLSFNPAPLARMARDGMAPRRVEETIGLLGTHLPPALLAAIAAGAGQVAATDGPSPKQEAFVNRLVEAWGIART
jgi:hypothetical protein